MAERRRRVEGMMAAVELLIKHQKTFNKKHTQEEEAGDLVVVLQHKLSDARRRPR